MHSTFATRWLLQTGVEACAPCAGWGCGAVRLGSASRAFLEPGGKKPVPLGWARGACLQCPVVLGALFCVVSVVCSSSYLSTPLPPELLT